MPTITELRSLLGQAGSSYTDEQIFKAAMAAYGPLYSSPQALQSELGFDPDAHFGRGLEIGLRGTAGAFAGAGAAAADAAGWTSGRDSMLQFAQGQQQRAMQLGRRSDDVDNFMESPGAFLKSAAGQAVGYAVPSLVGGGLPGLGVRVAGGTAARAMTAAAAGSFTSNLAQETGSIYNDLAEQGRYEPGRALMYGLPAAALDTASEAVPFLGRAASGNLGLRLLKKVPQQMAIEAGTETLQTGIERAGAYKDVLGPEAYHEYRNAAALGAVGGGMFGGVSAIPRYQPPAAPAPKPVADPDPGKPTDLLGPGTWEELAGAPVNPAQTSAPVDPQFAGFGNVDPSSIGDDPYGNYGLRANVPRGAQTWDVGFPEDISEPDVPSVLVADGPGAVAGTRYFDDLGATSWRGLPQTNGARWAAGQPALPDPRVTPMQPGAQMPLSGADDPGLALARQRYEELLKQNEAKRADQAAIKAAEEKFAARRTAATEALLELNEDGSAPIKLKEREITTHAKLAELRAAGGITPEQYQEYVGRLRDALKNDDRPVLNRVAKEVAELEKPRVTTPAGTGAVGAADLGRSTADQRAPGQPGGVRPAGAQPAAQAVAGDSAAPVRPGVAGGAGALTGPNLAGKFVERVQQLDPESQAYLSRWLGVEMDESGQLTLRQDGAESLRTMAGTLGVSYETVRGRLRQALRQMGLPETVQAQDLYDDLGLSAAGTDLDTVTRTTQGEPDGEPNVDALDAVEEVADDAALGGVGDTEVRALAPQRGPMRVGDDADAPFLSERPDDDPTGRVREVAGPIDENSLAAEDRIDESRTLTLDDALEADVAAGRVTADDVDEARYFYEQNRQRGMQPWGRLSVVDQATAVRLYARARLAGDPLVLATKRALYEGTQRTDGRSGSATDTGAARGPESGVAEGRDPAATAGDAGDQSTQYQVPAARGPAPVVTKRKRRVVRPEQDSDVTWGDQLQPSRAEVDPNATYHTAESLTDSLLTFMNADSLGRNVTVVESAADLESAADILAAYDDSAVAWARNGRAYLIADRIPVGKERGVFLHEVGGHLGLERMLKPEEFSRLVGKIVSWAGRDSNSTESKLAKLAMERVNQAGTEGAEARNAELVAYFLEEAVNAGVNPTAMKYDTELGRWMRSLWAAFKGALRRLGVNPDKLTAQDVVDLAYGAARVNVTGRFHGTAAKVQQFRTKYIGTGEGAQMYGWGLYFSELRGVGEQYKEADEKRKGGGATGGNKNASNFPMWAELKDLAKRDDYLGFDSLGEMLRAYLQDRKSNRGQQFINSFGDMDLDLAQTLRGFGDWWFKPAKEVKGNLYATDIAVKPDEFLDWAKPLDAQSETVKSAIQTELSKAYPDPYDPLYTSWRDEFRDGGFEQTGGGLYRYLETLAEQAQGPFEPNFELDDFLGRIADKYDAWTRDGRARTLDGKKFDASLTAEEKAEYERLRAQENANAVARAKSDAERVSRWLDSIGIKGVRMPVNYTKGGTYESGQNFVVFNEKNVIRALVNPQNNVKKSVQFSKSNPAAEAVAKLEEARASIRENLPAPAQDAVTNIGDAVRKYAPYLMSNFQLLEQFGSRIKALGKHVKFTELMTREATRQQMAYDAVGKRWEELRSKSRVAFDDLNKLMTEASRLAIHPDHAFGEKDWNDHLPADRKADHARLEAEYKRLKRTYPEAISIYHDALKVEEDSWNAQAKALEALYDNYGVARPDMKKAPGPYFPLMRHGEYLVIAKSQEMLDLEESIKGETDPNTRKAADKILAEMAKDPKHYWMSAHETRAAQEREAAKQQSGGGFASVVTPMAAQRLEHLPANVHRTVTTLTAVLGKSFDQGTVGQIEKAVAEMLLRTLPEGHALERQAQRRGVSGSNPDMLRSFMTAGRANSFYTARTMYAKDLAVNMQDMKTEVYGNVDLSHVFREIEKRVALDMQFNDTPVQNAINTVSWLYHLGVSPAFLAMNALQPALISFPVMAGRFGAAAAVRELGRAWREALQVMRAARFKDGKWSPWEGINPETVKSTRDTVNDKGEKVSEDRKAMRELMLRGIVDEGLVHDVGRLAGGDYSGLEKVSRYTGWASQQIELMNRLSTALATFRLARGSGMDYDMAVEEAYRATVKTQIDYSSEGAPRLMREGGGVPLAKLVFQFRRYQQGMLYLLLANAKDALKGDKQAMATMGYLGLVTGAVGGAIGMPFANAVLWALDKFIDKDDEDGDAETRLRNMLFDMTGDRKMANVLAKGLPAMFGMDMAKRIGLGDVATIIRMDDIEKAKTERDKLGQVLLALGGPGAGAFARIWEGANLMVEGDILRGVERALPKFAGDPVQAYRLASQGMTDRKGEQVLGADQLDAWDKVYKALGVSSTDITNVYEADAAKKRVQTAIDDRKKNIHREFRIALRDGDMSDVREKIARFNADHPQHAIKPKDEIAWRRDARRQEAMRGPEGVKFNPKRDQPYEDLQRFARG